MIFAENITELKGSPVLFADGDVSGCGTLVGMSGSGSVMIETKDDTVYVGMRNVYRVSEEIPDKECLSEYIKAKYMSRIGNLRELVDFALEFDLKHDREAKEAYIRRAYDLIGYQDDRR